MLWETDWLDPLRILSSRLRKLQVRERLGEAAGTREERSEIWGVDVEGVSRARAVDKVLVVERTGVYTV